MKGYCIIILIFILPIGIQAQTDCVDFNDYNSSQVWIKGIIKLDKQAQKDSILKRIACERIIGKQNIKFSLDCIFDGIYVHEIPVYRDFLLKNIDSHNMQLISSLCDNKNIYPEKCNLGILILSGLEKPVVNNIKELTINEIERKKGKIEIVINSLKSSTFDFKIEDFCNADNFKTDRKHLKRGNNKIKYNVDKELKLITILDNDNNLILIK